MQKGNLTYILVHLSGISQLTLFVVCVLQFLSQPNKRSEKSQQEKFRPERNNTSNMVLWIALLIDANIDVSRDQWGESMYQECYKKYLQKHNDWPKYPQIKV
jgi:hypothetical protein